MEQTGFIYSCVDGSAKIANDPKGICSTFTLVINGIEFAERITSKVQNIALKKLCAKTKQGLDLFSVPALLKETIYGEKDERAGNICLIFASIIDTSALLQEVGVLSYGRISTVIACIPYVHVVTRVALGSIALGATGVGSLILAVNAANKKKWMDVAENVSWVAFAAIVLTFPSATVTIFAFSTVQATITLVNVVCKKKDPITEGGVICQN